MRRTPMQVADAFKTLEYGPAPEAPDAVYAWLDEHKHKFGLFINNKWVEPSTKNYTESTSPATGEKLAEVAAAGRKDVEIAGKAARKAVETWSKTSGHQRARYLYAIAR